MYTVDQKNYKSMEEMAMDFFGRKEPDFSELYILGNKYAPTKEEERHLAYLEKEYASNWLFYRMASEMAFRWLKTEVLEGTEEMNLSQLLPAGYSSSGWGDRSISKNGYKIHYRWSIWRGSTPREVWKVEKL